MSNIGIITNDGRFGQAGPNSGLAGAPQVNPRWKHTAAVTHTIGAWKTTLSLGVNNITEEWPPLVANTIYSGAYPTSLADMMGRVYRVSLEYTF